MISDKDLLQMIMLKERDNDPTAIISQFLQYKTKLSQIEKQPDFTVEKKENTQEKSVEKSKRRYTKRDFVVKPENAIHEDYIQCCLCAKTCQNLTASHLKKEHNLTPAEYKKLCGYPATQILMSAKNLRRVTQAVTIAQAARKEKMIKRTQRS